jgi:phage shock protein PspC (stress-responsive transcriptional regulator)/predicted anti-sigma-YlaC factor YlaD
MSTNTNCGAFVDNVRRRLVAGETLTAEESRHLGGCSSCRAMIEAARSLSTLIDDEPASTVDEDVARVTLAAIHRKRLADTARKFGIASLVALAALAAIGWWLYASFAVGVSRGAERETFVAGTLSTILVVAFIVGLAPGVLFGRLRRWRLAPSRRTIALFLACCAVAYVAYRLAAETAPRFAQALPVAAAVILIAGCGAGLVAGAGGLPYKRLRDGRVLSGVLLGLAEKLALRPSIIRLLFLSLLLALGFPAVALYILLDLSMQVHPDDRAGLLRFRIQRWMRKRAAAALPS